MLPTEVEAILQFYDIECQTSGVNISDKCIGVLCPFCDDTNYHCGVFRDKGNFTCWRCGAKGSLFELLKEIKKITWIEYLEILSKQLQTTSKKVIPNKIVSLDCNLPKYYEPISTTSPDVALNYLSSRNLTLADALKYKLGFCKYGKYALRLIIPIYFEGKLVAFQARDVTGKSPIRYLTSENPINNYLYNYDIQPKKSVLIIVEGVFDVYGMNGQAVGSFGTKFTTRQIELIIKKEPEAVLLLWDNSIDDAYIKALKAANELKALIPIVYVPKLPKNTDPSILGYSACLELINKQLSK